VTRENRGRAFFSSFFFLYFCFCFDQNFRRVVLQPRREREKGFQSGSGCLPTPLPLSPPPTLLAAAAGCTLKQRAFLPLFLPPHTAHTISSPRLDFLAAYLSQSPHLLLDCNPHSPEPPPCRGSTARGSPLRETSPLRLEAIQMLIGRAAHGFLLFFIRQLLMPSFFAPFSYSV